MSLRQHSFFFHTNWILWRDVGYLQFARSINFSFEAFCSMLILDLCIVFQTASRCPALVFHYLSLFIHTYLTLRLLWTRPVRCPWCCPVLRRGRRISCSLQTRTGSSLRSLQWVSILAYQSVYWSFFLSVNFSFFLSFYLLLALEGPCSGAILCITRPKLKTQRNTKK